MSDNIFIAAAIELLVAIAFMFIGAIVVIAFLYLVDKKPAWVSFLFAIAIVYGITLIINVVGS